MDVEMDVECVGFHARLTQQGCLRNRAMAMRAAYLMWRGMKLRSLNPFDVDRMMVCCRCVECMLEELAESGINMREVYTRVRDELMAEWEKVEGDGSQPLERRDEEIVRSNKSAHYARWREKHLEHSRERQREWRKRKKEEEWRKKEEEERMKKARLTADLELGVGEVVDVGDMEEGPAREEEIN